MWRVPGKDHNRPAVFTKVVSGVLLAALAIAGYFLYDIYTSRAFAGGTGTPADPYIISDCTELQEMDDVPEYMMASFELSNDIDCSATIPFETIGTYQNYDGNFLPFMGRFDGQGHTISNVTVGTTTDTTVGIFATLYGATVRDLHLDNIVVHGANTLGALAGRSDTSGVVGVSVTNSTITAYSNTGGAVGGVVGSTLTSNFYALSASSTTVGSTGTNHTGSVYSFGGLVGRMYGFSTLDNSFANATVTADVAGVGGLVGAMGYGSIIKNSYAESVVTGYEYTGGILGVYEAIGNTPNYIESVYSDASVTATRYVSGYTGGILGGVSGCCGASMYISNSFAVGPVASTTLSGGISGVPAIMSNNFYSPASTGQTRCIWSGGASGCSTNSTASYYYSSANAPLSSWDFTNVWNEYGAALPDLQIFPYTEPSSATSIGSCAALASAVRTNPIGWFQLSGNIDCANDSSLVPLTGNVATSSGFFGVLDGQGFTIDGIGTTKTATAQYQAGLGLFQQLFGATVRDVTLNGSGIQAQYDQVDRVGGLAGTGMAVVVENVTSSVPVTTGEQFGGGLLGFGSGIFNNVVVNADVGNYSTNSYGYWTAGLIGDAYAVEMNNVEYNGDVTTYWYSGALVGYASIAQITNATTTGNFTGNVIAGGMIGSLGSLNEITLIKSSIDNAHSSMNFTTNSPIDDYMERIGGIVGYSQAGVDISNSSYTGTITVPTVGYGQTYNVGGLAGELSSDTNSATSTITNSFTDAYIVAIGDNGNDPYIENTGGFIGEAGYVHVISSVSSTSMLFGGSNPTEYIGGIDNSGGFVGYNWGGLLHVDDVQVNGSMTIYDDATGNSGGYGWGLGGFAGYLGWGLIENSTSSVDVFYQSFEPGAVSNFAGDFEFSTVRNVVVDGDLTIDAYENPYYIGGLGGYADTVTVATTTVRGDITMTNTLWPYDIGGLIGYLESSSIFQETYTDNSITINTGTDGSSAGPFAVGGFVGEISYWSTTNNIFRDTYASTTITITSSAIGTAPAGGNIAGYVGYIGASGNTITNSYSTGILTINTDSASPFLRIGGFMGWSDNGTSNTYSDLFSVMQIEPIASSTNVGGFVGQYNGGETISNIFFDATKTGQSLCSGIDGTDPVWCTVHNVANSEPTYFFDATNAPMSSWNFTTTWLEHPDTYPTFGVGGGGGGGPTAPTLTTNATASGVTQTAATLAGTITDLGSAAVTARGIVYGTTPFFSATSTENSAGFSTGAFSRSITSLVCGTTYYFAAYASSADGLSYGATESFSTSACATTPPPSSGSSSTGTKVKDKKSDTAVLTKTDSITICHSGDGSKYVTLTNVQVFITLAQSGATAELRGHDGHGADIVPSFQYDFGDGVHTYPGVNWTTENQKLFTNNCEKFLAIPPTPVPTPVPAPAPEPIPEPPIVLPPLDEPITVCDSVSVYTRVSVAPDTNTTVVTTVPQGAVKSKKTEETGKMEYQLTLTVQPVEAKRADALMQKFTDILTRFKAKRDDDKEPYGIVKKLADTPKKETAYQTFATNTAESTSATANSTTALIENPIPVVTTGDCDTATPESEPPLVPTPPPAPGPEVTPSPTPDTETPDTTTPPTPTDETVAPPEVPAVIVSDTLTEENIVDWLPEDVLPEDAELLVPPIQVAVETPEGEYLEAFESPVTIDVTNPAVAGLTENDLIILQPSADGTQWYEVPYTIENDTLHITVSHPGEIFVWFIPKQALAAEESGVAGTLTPLIDIEIPLIVVKLLSYFGLGAGVAYALMQLSRTPVSASTFRRSLLEGWHNLLALVTAKKRRRPWGTVYDSVTKAPVDPAYVELFTEDGHKQADAITDLDGRYGFLVPEGMYTMIVRKTNYAFPSKRSLGGQDVIYSHLYYGGSLDVSATVAHDIPMDPVNFDWNQYEKLRTKQTRYFHLLDPLIVRFFDFAFFLGVALMLWQFLRDMTLTTSLLLGCYCILLLARFFGARPVLYGSITENGLPLQFALVRIMQGNTTILTKVTDAEGRYAALVSPDTYTVRIEKRVSDTEYVPVFERKIRARKGVINERLRV